MISIMRNNTPLINNTRNEVHYLRAGGLIFELTLCLTRRLLRFRHRLLWDVNLAAKKKRNNNKENQKLIYHE